MGLADGQYTLLGRRELGRLSHSIWEWALQSQEEPDEPGSWIATGRLHTHTSKSRQIDHKGSLCCVLLTDLPKFLDEASTNVSSRELPETCLWPCVMS